MNHNKRQKREKEIKIRLSDDEHERLMAKKNQRALAPWMREFCLTQNQRTSTTTIFSLDPIIRRQLIGVSTNINQMAKHINSNLLEPLHISSVLVDLKICQNLLLKISEAISQKNDDSRKI